MKTTIKTLQNGTIQYVKETHFETLSKYIFAQKITVKKGGYYYQLFELKNDKIVKIGGLNEDGFILNFLNGTRSGSACTIVNLYNAIRGTNDDMLAFKK